MHGRPPIMDEDLEAHLAQREIAEQIFEWLKSIAIGALLAAFAVVPLVLQVLS